MNCCNDGFYVNTCGCIVDNLCIGCGRRNVKVINNCTCGQTTTNGSYVSQTEQTLDAQSLISLPIVIYQNGITATSSVFTVGEAGTYKIDYGINSGEGTSATVGLLVNSVVQSGSQIFVDDTSPSATNSLIITLGANSQLSLSVLSGTLVLNENTTNAYLTITKL